MVDADSAFATTPNHTTTYMDFPKGMKSIPGHALLLTHSLNDTKQGAHDWHRRAHDALTEMDFRASAIEPCLYHKWKHGALCMVALYADDFRIISDVENDVRQIEMQLKGHFKLKTSAHNQLGLKIDKSINGIYISARAKIESVLKDIGMADCKPCTTPAAPGSKLPKLENTEEAVTSFPYREAVGALLWLARTARPDIVYAVAELTKHCNAYGNEHVDAVKRTLRYLKGTINLGAMYLHSLWNFT
jgi:hypothetical protein